MTARSFVDAFNRFANPRMQSTGVAFLDIVQGAQAVIDGKARTISGVRAQGNKLVVQLTKASPDFLARLTMPFMQAIDTNLARQIDANGINQYASCGPYYFSSRTPGRSITLKRNPHYKGGRAANVDTIQVNVGNDIAVQFQNVERATSDYASTGIPPTEWKNVVSKYGLNKKDGRVQVRSLLDIRYVAMNHSRPMFKNNPGLAKAVNWTVDRQAFSAQGGYLYGKRTGQILPPGMLGYKPQGIYPLRITANTIKQAKKLAEGNLRGGKAVLWSSNSGIAPLQAQLIQYNLRQIGLDAEIRLLPRAQQFTNAGNPQTATFDMTIERWGSDYADPYDFVNILLDGKQVTQSQHNNYSYFNVAKYNRQMTGRVAPHGAAPRLRLRGPRRGPDAGEPAVGAARQLERPDLPVVPGGVRHRQRGPRQRADPERGLHEVTTTERGGAAHGRPSPSRDDDRCSSTSHDDFSGRASSSSGVTMITYVLFFLLPADPARLAAGKSATEEDVARVAHQLGLDRPVHEQYGLFLKRLVVDQSLGRSYANRREVNEMIGEAVPVTAALVLGGAVLWMLIALPIGILSALRPQVAARQGGDDLHPHRDLCARRLDRAAPAVLRRLQVGPDPERGVLRRDRPARGGIVWRAGRLGLPHDPSLADLRDPLRRELRANDPRERDGHAR